MLRTLSCTAVALTLLLTTPSAHARKLVSQWDTPVPFTDTPFACPIPAEISPDIVSTKAPKDSPDPDASLAESGTALNALAKLVVRAADTYRATGSRAAAQCVITHLSAAAADHAMDGQMFSKEVYFVQGEVLSALAVAYLKVRPSGLATPDRQANITGWMTSVALDQRQFYRDFVRRFPKLPSGHNHHLYTAAYAAASVAIATNDRSLFNWAVDIYHLGVDDIDPKGMLYWEKCAKGEAAKCHLQAAAPLVLLAEYGELNGDPLYDYDRGAIHLLVKNATRGILDPQRFHQFAGYVNQTLPDPIQPWEIAWAAPYDRRFPDPVIESILRQLPDLSVIDLGGEPAI